MKIQLKTKYEEIISLENLLLAWQEFVRGKKNKRDVQEFGLRLMDNLFSLRLDLINHTYKHGGYQAFKISDPKPRDIHKATVRDRLLHHAVCRQLFPLFSKTFIADSYSCQLGKGTHRALNAFRRHYYSASQNNTRTCWVLKGDIKKFFANIDHAVLMDQLTAYIPDKQILDLLGKIISSFSTAPDESIGLPLGNLTSQLLVNVYMNPFDQFVKHKLKAKHYLRYADDFVILSSGRKQLEKFISPIDSFLRDELNLRLHPDKLFIKTVASGVDFLGMVHFPDHRILRTATKRRVFVKLGLKCRLLRQGLITEQTFCKSLSSYHGLLKHCNGQIIQSRIASIFRDGFSRKPFMF